MMERSHIEEYKKKLLQTKEEISTAHRQAASAGAPVALDQTRQGRLSRMDALQQAAMADATQARRETELRRIEAALSRLDGDDYGYCSVCDEPISRARLLHNPASVNCIKHAR